MKTKNLSIGRLFLYVTIPLFAMLFLVACSKDNSGSNSETKVYTTQGNANGSQQNPQVTTNGTATLVGTFNSTTNDWEYSINWSSLTGAATLIEFHGPANLGLNGDIMFSLTVSSGGVNGAASGTVKLTDQQEAYLMNGQIYYTIVTSAHLTGEVRGQIYVLAR